MFGPAMLNLVEAPLRRRSAARRRALLAAASTDIPAAPSLGAASFRAIRAAQPHRSRRLRSRRLQCAVSPRLPAGHAQRRPAIFTRMAVELDPLARKSAGPLVEMRQRLGRNAGERTRQPRHRSECGARVTGKRTVAEQIAALLASLRAPKPTRHGVGRNCSNAFVARCAIAATDRPDARRHRRAPRHIQALSALPVRAHAQHLRR